ncbi:MAG: type VI secretion system lipoprotein TssJ [Pseudomonadota bacterium]
MMLHKFTFFKASILLLLATFILSCSPKASKSKIGRVFKLNTDIDITLLAEADINPDEAGRPSPVFLRMYALKSDKMFNRFGFIEFFERDEEILGADLITKRELQRLAPGESRVDKFMVDEDTRYVAVFAEFFRYSDANYKIIFPVTGNNVFDTKATVKISGSNISLVD